VPAIQQFEKTERFGNWRTDSGGDIECTNLSARGEGDHAVHHYVRYLILVTLAFSSVVFFLPDAFSAVDSIACGKACMRKGQYKRAVSDFETAVKKSPKSCEGHLLLGQVYCRLKQYKDGKEQLRLAIRYGHGSPNAQQANVEMLKLPQELIAPRSGPDTQKLVSMLNLPAASDDSSKPTVIDFYATWCNPCQQLHTVLEKAKGQYGDKINFVRVDVDDDKNQKLIDQYDVSPIPTVVYLDAHGVVVGFSIGFAGESNIEAEIKKIIAQGL
jgi:thioredoxin 1